MGLAVAWVDVDNQTEGTEVQPKSQPGRSEPNDGGLVKQSEEAAKATKDGTGRGRTTP